MTEKINLLIVDDDQDIDDTLAYYFNHKGYSVVTAVTGEEAIHKLSSFDAHIMVTDLQMPGMNGMALKNQQSVLEYTEKGNNTPITVARTALTGWLSLRVEVTTVLSVIR